MSAVDLHAKPSADFGAKLFENRRHRYRKIVKA